MELHERAIVCHFVLFILAIVLSVLRFTDSDYPFGILKLYFIFSYKCPNGIRDEKNGWRTTDTKWWQELTWLL